MITVRVRTARTGLSFLNCKWSPEFTDVVESLPHRSITIVTDLGKPNYLDFHFEDRFIQQALMFKLTWGGS